MSNHTFYLISWPLALLVLLAAVPGAGQPGTAPRTETLKPVAALPPHLAGQFQEMSGFDRLPSGQYLVLDRRSHAIYGVDAAMTGSWLLVRIGHEAGRVLQPFAFGAGGDGTFVVADAPRGQERVQVFEAGGRPIGGFTLPGTARGRVALDGVVLSGVGTLKYTGRSVLVNRPETGSLITQYSLSGGVLGTVGRLRATGREDDPLLHAAFNSGIPLPDPTGGYFFVFQTGEPRFRKYAEDGALVYERVIQGRELDELVASQPTTWIRRGPDEVPIVTPVVRAAAVDGDGRLWVALTVPWTYVYEQGEKARTVQFRGAGILQPSSLTFTRNGRLLVTPGGYVFRPQPGS